MSVQRIAMFASTTNVHAVPISTKVHVVTVSRMQTPKLLAFAMILIITVTLSMLVFLVVLIVPTASVTLSMSVLTVEADFIFGTSHISVSRSALHTSWRLLLTTLVLQKIQQTH